MRIKDFGAAKPPVSGSTAPAAVTASRTEQAARGTTIPRVSIITSGRTASRPTGEAYWAACPFSKAAAMQAKVAENEWFINELVGANKQANPLTAMSKASTFFGQVHGLFGAPVDPNWGDARKALIGYVVGRLGVLRTLPAAACTLGERYTLASDDPNATPFLWTYQGPNRDGLTGVFRSEAGERTWPLTTSMVPAGTAALLLALSGAGKRAIAISEEIIGGNASLRSAAEAAVWAVFPCSDEEGRAAAAEAEAAGEADRLRREQAVADQLARNAAAQAAQDASRDAYVASLQDWKGKLDAWEAGVTLPSKSPLGAAAALAAAGFFVGGPIGAAAGGVVGLLAGGGGGGSMAAPPVQPGRPSWMTEEEAAELIGAVLSG